MTELTLGIIFEGVKGFNRERREAFNRKYKKIIDKVNEATDAHYPNYSDAVLALSEQDQETLGKAYLENLKAHNKENGNV